MARIYVTLSTYDTGFEEEADWDAWTAYVAAHLDELVGEPVEVDAMRWSARQTSPGRDIVQTRGVGMREHTALESLVRDSIQTLWERWCAEGAPATEGR